MTLAVRNKEGVDRGPVSRKPDWFKISIPAGENAVRLKSLLRTNRLHTVCEEARCPNMGECWSAGTATFMILGDICTRSCGFCAVRTGKPQELDLDEPRRVAESIRVMDIHHAVITSVNRDELPDGGSVLFAETIVAVRLLNPSVRVEVLIPDFRGERAAIKRVIDAGPDILNHNIETVPRLYSRVRPQAKYEQSLELLRYGKERGMVTKSGMMLGLGEESGELEETFGDLKKVGCEILTLGQYLQPTSRHLPVERYVSPEEFDGWRRKALSMGFRFVESGPLVRSSYHAERHIGGGEPDGSEFDGPARPL